MSSIFFIFLGLQNLLITGMHWSSVPEREYVCRDIVLFHFQGGVCQSGGGT